MSNVGQGLPDGWAAAELALVAASERPRKLPADCGNLPYVGMEQIEAHSRRLLGTLPASQFKSSAFHFQNGDVLYGRLRPYLNKVWGAEFEGLCSAEFIVLTASGAILPQYLSLYLNGDEFLDFASNLDRGDRPRISFDQIASYRIPLPPLVEQRRIVAEVAPLLARVQPVRQQLTRVPAIVKRFRQSVLAAATSGRLSSPLEAGDRSYENDSFPERWQQASVADVCALIVDCPHSTPKWTDAGEICLRTTNFRAGQLDLKEVRYVSSETFLARTSRTTPQPGDVLYSREGGILGIACMIPQGLRCCLGQRMMLLRPDVSRSLPQYLMHVLNAPITTSVVRDLTGGTASPHLNVGDVKRFSIPLPEITEQERIVRRVDALFALADAIERRVAAAFTRVDRLTQAILAKAFRGELVPTEAELARAEGRDYETAEQLLERIRSEQGAALPRKQAKRSRKTASS